MRLNVRDATVADAMSLSKYLRKDDVREIAALTGREPVKSLMDGVLNSDECKVATIDGEIMSMWGVARAKKSSVLGERLGIGWLLTSDLVDSHPLTFWRLSKAILDDMFERWDCITNFMDCRYLKAKRWGMRLGFIFLPPNKPGVLDVPFQQFIITRESLNV